MLNFSKKNAKLFKEKLDICIKVYYNVIVTCIYAAMAQ